MSFEGNYFLSRWIDSWALLLIKIFPLLLISIYAFKLGIGKFDWFAIRKRWRNCVVYIVLVFILIEVYYKAHDMINALLINLIKVPFEENTIPGIFTVIITLFLNSAFYIVFANISYYSLMTNFEKNNEVLMPNDDLELLDQFN